MLDIPAKSDLTYFDSAQLSVIPQLQFRFCELANAWHSNAWNAVFAPFNVSCVTDPNASCCILCSIRFTIDQARKLFMNLAMCGVSNLHWGEPIWARDPLMHNCIWPYWFVIAQLSNVLSAFVASQEVAKCHPLSCLLSTYFLTRSAL